MLSKLSEKQVQQLQPYRQTDLFAHPEIAQGSAPDGINLLKGLHQTFPIVVSPLRG